MDMLFKYREAFSFKDEIGTCPNIEVEINVTEKSPFFIRPYHIRQEDKAFIDRDEVIMLHGYSEGRFLSPVMLIHRKLTKDKRVVRDFRHLNVRIAKNNFGLSISKGHILSITKFQMQGTISIRSERCLSFTEII